MLSTRPARAAAGAAVTVVAAVGLVLFTGGAALADHLDAPGGPGNPGPAEPQLTLSSPEVVEGTGGTNELVFVLERTAEPSSEDTQSQDAVDVRMLPVVAVILGILYLARGRLRQL